MSHTQKPIVVAIVDKQPSVLRFAIREAHATGAPLRIVHSDAVLPQGIDLYVGASATMLDDLRSAGQIVLDDARELIAELAPALEVDYVLTNLAPLEALRMQSIEARILVVGADDVSWLERLMRTKIAGYLATHATCPVVVVPEHGPTSEADGEIVVSLDGDSTAPGPLRMAFEEADARDCLLHVLHSTPPGTLSSDVDASRASLTAMLASWRETYPDVAVLEGFVTDDSAGALSRAAQSADLVIVGRPHSHRTPLSLSRPLAMKVLGRASCPVAIVPPDYHGQ